LFSTTSEFEDQHGTEGGGGFNTRNLQAESIRALAPENGAAIDSPVTNAQSGCGLLMTEFTSADGLARMRETKRRRYLTFYDDEHPIGAQLFGANPETLAEAARIVEETGFDLVDLNLGCPAKRVVGSNGGSGLHSGDFQSRAQSRHNSLHGEIPDGLE
jgi:tRNA-dihydrouridine synthase